MNEIKKLNKEQKYVCEWEEKPSKEWESLNLGCLSVHSSFSFRLLLPLSFSLNFTLLHTQPHTQNQHSHTHTEKWIMIQWKQQKKIGVERLYDTFSYHKCKCVCVADKIQHKWNLIKNYAVHFFCCCCYIVDTDSKGNFK